MRGRWRDLPLRVRLTLLYVALLLVLLTALGTFVYLDTRNFMIEATAARLEALANNSIAHLVSPGPRPPGLPDGREPITPTVTLEGPPFENIARSLARDLTWQDTTAIVLDASGAQIGGEGTVADPAPNAAPDATTLHHAFTGESVTYLATVNAQETLAVLIPVRYPRTGSTVAGVIQMTVPLDSVNLVLQRQRTLLLIGSLMALVLGTLGGLWLTQSALAPLRRVIAVCRRIAGGDLSQRVNLPRRQDETGQLAAAFDEMVARLDDSFNTQRQFVADASHELRTPLTALTGSLDVLLMKPEGDPETSRRVLHGMRREVQRLTRLVTDLLTLTRLDAHRPLKTGEVNITALARDVMENVRSLAGNRKLALEADADAKAMGDGDQLKQVFYNLLGNAIQATDAETGAITVRVRSTEQAVCIEVADNGIGIPQQAQAHIFERFYRADRARARASGGSGLGLAIVKEIVEGHGGNIGPVESTPGKGTTLKLTLPRPPGRAAPRPKPGTPLR